MPYTGPPTLAPGEVPSFDQWNTFVRANMEFFAQPPAAKVTRSTLQTIATGGAGASITFDTEVSDTDTMFAGPATTLTVNTPGLYVITCGAVFASNATGNRQLAPRVNAVVVGGASVAAVNGAPTVLSGAATVKLNIGDSIDLLVFQSSGGNLDVTVTAMVPYLTANWVGLG